MKMSDIKQRLEFSGLPRSAYSGIHARMSGISATKIHQDNEAKKKWDSVVKLYFDANAIEDRAMELLERKAKYLDMNGGVYSIILGTKILKDKDTENLRIKIEDWLLKKNNW